MTIQAGQDQFLSIKALDAELARDMADLGDYPEEFVYYAYQWGKGELAGHDGPDTWQLGWLKEWGQEIRLRGFDGRLPVAPVRMSTTSGHGVGKSMLVAVVVNCIMSTRPHCKGIITANTSPQLETKTWAEITKWTKRCITRHWFKLTGGRGAMKMVHRDHPDSWRVDAMAWRKDQPEAFAGLHAANSTPFFIFDEASGVAKIIFETAMGGMTDGEPMMFLFSNPTKGTGFFFDTHHDLKHRFKTFQVDSRTAKMTNKTEIAEWIEDWGIDSDFVKVRVLGEFPMIGDRQFIPAGLVSDAMDLKREPFYTALDPIILGVDVARYGDDESVIYLRRGRDARTQPMLVFKGLDTNKLSHEIRFLANKLYPDAINVDGGGVGAGVIDNLRAWGVPNVNEINFGGVSPDPDYANMASYMMGASRDWLKQQGVCLQDDRVLKRQLTVRRYEMVDSKRGTAIRVESKDDMKQDADIKESPDRADAFGLTFAVPVKVRNVEKTMAEIAGRAPSNVIGVEYERT